MERNTTASEGKGLDSGNLDELRREVREKMRELDAALESVGSPRRPEKRLDRAPLPEQTTPIFNPAMLTY